MTPDPLPLINPIKKYALYTNAKCGGTTIKAWFLSNLELEKYSPKEVAEIFGIKFFVKFYIGQYRGVARRKEISNELLRRFINGYRREVSKKLLKDSLSGEYRNVLITRNPYHRVVSAYLDKFCGEDKDKTWVQEVVLKAGDKGDFTFLDFLSYLENEKEECQNPHWRRQTFIVDDIGIDYYVKLEDIFNDMSTISDVVGGRDFELLQTKRQNTEYDKEMLWEGYSPDQMSQKDIAELSKELGCYPRYNLFLTEETIVRIYNIYLKDFERLPYRS